MGGARETIFEFTRLGTALKVTAVDPETGVEAVLIGDPARGEGELTHLAQQKLDYVLAKRRPGGG